MVREYTRRRKRCPVPENWNDDGPSHPGDGDVRGGAPPGAEEDGKGPPRKFRAVWGNIDRDKDDSSTGSVFQEGSDEWSTIAFCCAVCHCPRKRRAKYDGAALDKESSNSLYHRKCCHNLPPGICDEDWLSPMNEAHQAGLDKEFKSAKPTIVTKAVIQKKYKEAKRQESELYNDDENVDYHSLLATNEDYVKNQKNFIELSKACATTVHHGMFVEPRRATVLSLFSGIGADIVCLKRLKIAIAKVIHVEWDKVATHVFKSNHDPAYGENLQPDGIQYVYYGSFEYVMDNVAQIMEDHKPIDIIIAGPPCVDYTYVNARRQGADGYQGSYMLNAGELVKHIDQAMRRLYNRPVFFLAENTVISNDRNKRIDDGDLNRVKQAWGISWDPPVFDSRLISPLRRKRTYVSNIPFDLKSREYSNPRPKSCFDDKFDIAPNILEEHMVTKALGLMASLGRIDDSRMNVYRGKGGTKYEERKLNIQERERLMGMPEGYIAEPVDYLFNTLFHEGHFRSFVKPPTMNWNHCLPRKLYTFAGDYHRFRGKYPGYKFEATSDGLEMKMAPSKTTKTPYYFNKEGYAKRLIGNSFSIPTVEILLRPLQAFYSSQDYPRFNYEFAWNKQVGVTAQHDGTNPLASKPTRDELQAFYPNNVADFDDDASDFSGITYDPCLQDVSTLYTPEAASTPGGKNGAASLDVTTDKGNCQGGAGKVDAGRPAAAVALVPDKLVEGRRETNAKPHFPLMRRMESQPSDMATKRPQNPQQSNGGESAVGTTATSGSKELVLEAELKLKAYADGTTISDQRQAKMTMDKTEHENIKPTGAKSEEDFAPEVASRSTVKVDPYPNEEEIKPELVDEEENEKIKPVKTKSEEAMAPEVTSSNVAKVKAKPSVEMQLVATDLRSAPDRLQVSPALEETLEQEKEVKESYSTSQEEHAEEIHQRPLLDQPGSLLIQSPQRDRKNGDEAEAESTKPADSLQVLEADNLKTKKTTCAGQTTIPSRVVNSVEEEEKDTTEPVPDMAESDKAAAGVVSDTAYIVVKESAKSTVDTKLTEPEIPGPVPGQASSSTPVDSASNSYSASNQQQVVEKATDSCEPSNTTRQNEPNRTGSFGLFMDVDI